MELEEFLSLLGENAEAKEAAKEMLAAEKQKGIESYKKKDGEALKWKNRIKELGYDPEKDENFDVFKDTLVKKTEGSKLTIAALNEKLEAVEAKLEAEKTEKIKASEAAKRAKVEAKLQEAIGPKLYASKYIIGASIDRFDIDETGNVVGKTGAFDEAIKTILEENKENLKSEQTPGSETRLNTSAPATETDFIAKMKERMGQR